MSYLSVISYFSKHLQGVISLFPTTATHNLEKFKAFRIIFHNLALDCVLGPYLEFGVAYGNSMRGALIANRNTRFKALGIGNLERRFLGFDTFSGFESLIQVDVSTLYKNSDAGLNLERLVREDMIAVALFDMDLMAPTYSALKWIEPKIKSGTILVFDEFFGFRGDSKLGEAGAFNRFLNEHEDIEVREVMKYGTGGVVFQVSSRN